MRPLPFAAWQSPDHPGRLWFGGGAVAFALPFEEERDGGHCSLWIGARTPEPLAYLHAVVDASWEHAALGGPPSRNVDDPDPDRGILGGPGVE
ncbi:hypothetical protein [Paludisphaera soli]|uniref:hypothetical protein n=1 Tax=Paludisphaera soli TaxID=2712865 RepID=UPI0013EBDA76|nr:hypothetical protein [Paludisphaera soli]